MIFPNLSRIAKLVPFLLSYILLDSFIFTRVVGGSFLISKDCFIHIEPSLYDCIHFIMCV